MLYLEDSVNESSNRVRKAMNLEGNNISSQSDDDQLPDDELVEELYDKEKSGAENATIDIYSKDRKVIKSKY